MAARKVEAIEIPPVNIQMFEVTLVGDSSLICHRFSDEAKKAILDKQMKKATGGRKTKDPEHDYEESLYKLPGNGYGFPMIAFKAAAVDACSQVDGITKVLARQAFHIRGEYAEITGEPTMREDMVRVGMGSDIRYRAEFPEWRVTLSIRYNASVLSVEQIINLFNLAGFGVGIGNWRPQKDGSHGLFHVATEGEVA